MEAIFPLLNVVFVVSLVMLGLFAGRYNEKTHYRSIHQREKDWAKVPTTDLRVVLSPEEVVDARIVFGSVVVSLDYFKRIVAGLRMIFGGEVRSYTSLIDRGRREAILRMKESYPEADEFVNMRLETSSIAKGGNKKGIGGIEVLAYGTAIRRRT